MDRTISTKTNLQRGETIMDQPFPYVISTNAFKRLLHRCESIGLVLNDSRMTLIRTVRSFHIFQKTVPVSVKFVPHWLHEDSNRLTKPSYLLAVPRTKARSCFGRMMSHLPGQEILFSKTKPALARHHHMHQKILDEKDLANKRRQNLRPRKLGFL